MNRVLGNKAVIAAFVLPALALFVLLEIVPLFATGYYSLFDYNGIGSKTWIGLQNYGNLFVKDRYFFPALGNSFLLAGASVLIQLPLSLILAMVLASGVRGEQAFRNIYFLPVMISSMVIGQLWMRVFNSDGMFNALLGLFGKNEHTAWLAQASTAFLCTVVPAVWQYIGHHMLILYAGIKSIPGDYYEAAKIDGATGVRAAIHITLPLLMPVIKICVVFALVGSLRSFDLVYVMTKGGPSHASELPATLMYSSLFERGQYGYGSAEAFFIVLECLFFTLVVNRVFRKSEDNASMA
jgi:raffinose/stachyose/melibiose transport system permease protein